MLNPRWLLVLPTLLALACPVVAEEPGGAATPEALLEKLQAAEKSGDIKAVIALMGGPHRPLLEKAIEVFKAGEAFDGAMNEKFGTDPNYRSRFSSPTVGEQSKKVELMARRQLTPDRLELTLWTTRVESVAARDSTEPKEREVIWESREIAIKTKTGWLLLAPIPFAASAARMEKRRTPDGKEIEVRVKERPKEPTEKEIAKVRELLPKLQTVLELAAKDVAAGKHATRKAALDAVDKSIRALFPNEAK